MVLFCRSWIALFSFRKVRGLIVFFPFLKFMIAHLATPDRRESSLFEIASLLSGFDLDILRRLLFRTRGKVRPPGPVLPRQCRFSLMRRLWHFCSTFSVNV